MKIPPPFLGLLSSPYFAHDASCVMLNIDWTPLIEALTCARKSSTRVDVYVYTSVLAYLLKFLGFDFIIISC